MHRLVTISQQSIRPVIRKSSTIYLKHYLIRSTSRLTPRGPSGAILAIFLVRMTAKRAQPLLTEIAIFDQNFLFIC